jgi:hypothetical protein
MPQMTAAGSGEEPAAREPGRGLGGWDGTEIAKLPCWSVPAVRRDAHDVPPSRGRGPTAMSRARIGCIGNTTTFVPIFTRA